MNCQYVFRYFALVVLAITSIASADVRLPNILGNNMLLQRDLALPVWGWADPDEKIVVRFAGQQVETVADEHGRWNVKLEPLAASNEGQTMEIIGNNKIRLENILVGDVWICSGQSNMEWNMKAITNSASEITAADFPNIRLFNVPGHSTSPTPLANCGGQWQACSPGSVESFSAVGFFFGKSLHTETDVPVGLIGTNWGGTRIEPWTPPVGFRNVPELKSISEQVDKFDVTTDAGRATWNQYYDDVKTWANESQSALENGTPLPAPVQRPGFSGHTQPSAIYHAMVHPLAPYGVRGAIWYQGESNGAEGIEYHHKMKALINGWREVWGQKDFPMYFYFVQLANFRAASDDPAGNDGWNKLRDAQTATLSVPYTGMAVIIDIGEANDIHPRNKQDVGKRLARWALRDVFEINVEASGPIYKSMQVDGGKIVLSFDHVGAGLAVGNKVGLDATTFPEDVPLKRFAIAGEDQKWVWADAKIVGDTVVVSHKDVTRPVAVRYAWSMNPEGANLYNRDGLPASPFRTDDW